MELFHLSFEGGDMPVTGAVRFQNGTSVARHRAYRVGIKRIAQKVTVR